jgi:hypothetical protein
MATAKSGPVLAAIPAEDTWTPGWKGPALAQDCTAPATGYPILTLASGSRYSW